MAITLEAIRAAGGIVHSDGNIFFRDISMLQGLAGAAPAAVAGPAREEIAALRAEHGITSSGRGIKEFEQVDAFVRAVLQRWGAAPALEAPAAPAGALKREAELLATILRSLAPEGYVPEGVDIYAPDFAPSDGDVFVRRAAQVLEALAAAPQAPAAPSGPPSGWVPCILTHDGQHPEEVAYGPQIMMDRLKKWLGRYFELLAQKVLAEPVQAEMLAALQAVAMDVVHVGAGENTISDAARAKVEAVLEKIGAPWPGPAAAPAAPAVDAPKELDPELSREVYRACEDLPEGWSIRIDLENGYGGVVLVGPDGEEDELPVDGMLSDAMRASIAAAQAAAKGENGNG